MINRFRLKVYMEFFIPRNPGPFTTSRNGRLMISEARRFPGIWFCRCWPTPPSSRWSSSGRSSRRSSRSSSSTFRTWFRTLSETENGFESDEISRIIWNTWSLVRIRQRYFSAVLPYRQKSRIRKVLLLLMSQLATDFLQKKNFLGQLNHKIYSLSRNLFRVLYKLFSCWHHLAPNVWIKHESVSTKL